MPRQVHNRATHVVRAQRTAGVEYARKVAVARCAVHLHCARSRCVNSFYEPQRGSATLKPTHPTVGTSWRCVQVERAPLCSVTLRQCTPRRTGEGPGHWLSAMEARHRAQRRSPRGLCATPLAGNDPAEMSQSRWQGGATQNQMTRLSLPKPSPQSRVRQSVEETTKSEKSGAGRGGALPVGAGPAGPARAG